MKRRNILILAGAAVIILAAVWFFGSNTDASAEDIVVNAKRGDFKIEITTTGELQAKNSVKITGPSGLRAARIWQVAIEKIVDEGTIVKKGDFVASLDKSELADRIKSVQNDYQQSLSKYTQTKLDTALNLRQSRDDLINLKFAVEEKKLVVDQSQYEPPATIKQAELDYDKAKRTYQQAKENYQLQKRKAVAQMQQAAAELADHKNELDFLSELMKKFVIRAPKDGMVIYDRDYDGQPKTAGTTIGAWDPTVATLPDLSQMISTTYVNEVDIRKVAKGQSVDIGLDAFPDKKLTGQVISVANIGQQRPNSDAKVFEVKIEVNEQDTTLRPAMTTSNAIITDVIPNVVYVPLEAVQTQGDSLTYVVKRSGLGITKQQVLLGKSNANEVIVQDGVEDGDQVYLTVPDRVADESVSLLKDKSLTAEKQ